MNKEKIVLKDGTQIEIEGGASENVITTLVTDFTTIANLFDQKLTEANLQSYKILNAAGLECATRTNKYVESVTVSKADAGYKASFSIANVDMVAKQLAELKQGQEIQDAAIVELAGMAGGV